MKLLRKMLLLTFTIGLTSFLNINISFSQNSNLPKCYPEKWSSSWNNCVGSYVWKSGNKYSGEWKNGKIDGEGKKTWKSGATFSGEFKNGERFFGTFTWSSGNKYYGQYKNLKRHGQGVFTWPSGDKFVGEFKSGKRHGQGTFTWITGASYHGEWENGQQHGEGVYTSKNGATKEGIWKKGKFLYSKKIKKNNSKLAVKSNDNLEKGKVNLNNIFTHSKSLPNCSPNYANDIQKPLSWNWDNCFGTVEYKKGKFKGWKYEGAFKNGRPHGHGITVQHNGDKYVGNYKYGKKNGKGTYYLLSEGQYKHDIYEGNFKDGVKHGMGTYLYLGEGKNKGDKFVGEFKNDKRHGNGTYFHKNGDKYVGNYKNGKIDGYGVYNYNGHEYKGEFKDGKRHGEGVFVWANGRIQEGVWKNDKFQYKKKIKGNTKSFANLNSSKNSSLASNQTKDPKKRPLASVSDTSVCYNATTTSNGNKVWNDRNENFVGEAKYRGLDCGVTEKNKTFIASKPKNTKPSISSLELEKEKAKRKALEQRIAELEKKNNELQQPKKIKRKQSNEVGSGFYVSKFRHILTNQHVVNQCKKISVGDSIDKQIPANLIASDKRNDLAILQTLSMEMASADTKSFVQNLSIKIVPIVSGGLIREEDVIGGEQIFVAGYPLGDMVSDSMRLLPGLVNATKGYDNDITQFETDASIKKGNSGGPIYDMRGNIVGVAVKRLNVSQSDNFNFAIKGRIVKQFLDAHGVITSIANRKSQMSSTEIYKIASKQTVMVICHR